MSAWVWLGLAGLAEVVFTLVLKMTDGFTRPWPVAVLLPVMVTSLFCMSRAVTVLPLGTVYAVWTGIGTAGALAWGILAFGEPASAPRIFCILLILVGVVGVRLVS
jgi:quaternary ammonium compound-resistance protein SugE